MRRPSTTSWSPLPPRTREARFDEKWAFVAKKEARCDPDDPADARKGVIGTTWPWTRITGWSSAS